MNDYCFNHKSSFFPTITPLCEQFTLLSNSKRAPFSPSVDSLPPSLSHLILGDGFNSNLSKLPSSITHLLIQGDFDKNVIFPSSLTHLICFKVRNTFASPLLPSSLVSFVHIDSHFSVRFPPSLPSLQQFYFDYTIHVPPFSHIPISPCLTHLWLPILPSPSSPPSSPVLKNSSFSSLLPLLPPSITHLHGDFDLDQVGSQVKFLIIPSFDSSSLLPESLTHVSFFIFISSLLLF